MHLWGPRGCIHGVLGAASLGYWGLYIQGAGGCIRGVLWVHHRVLGVVSGGD